MKQSRLKYIYLLIGWFFTILGFIGIIIPVLPTTPFLLVAVWGFSKSSEKLHNYLFEHKIFGQYLRDWFEHGAIHKRAKILAVTFMWLSLSYVIYKYHDVSLLICSLTFVSILALSIFIVSRPSSPKKAEKNVVGN